MRALRENCPATLPYLFPTDLFLPYAAGYLHRLFLLDWTSLSSDFPLNCNSQRHRAIVVEYIHQ